MCQTKKWGGKAKGLAPPSNSIGRDERIRTSDPSVPNAVLYQTEPHPDPGNHEKKCPGSSYPGQKRLRG
jgi:hypothetical protein